MELKKKLKKKDGWKKSGVTLIEVAGALAIYLILFLVITKGISQLLIETNYVYSDQLRKNSIESGTKNLKEYLGNPSNLDYEVVDNKFIVYKKSMGNTPLKDEIYFSNNKLYLKYYREENGKQYVTTSVIFLNLLDFKIIKKENLVYFLLRFDEGEKIICV